VLSGRDFKIGVPIIHVLKILFLVKLLYEAQGESVRKSAYKLTHNLKVNLSNRPWIPIRF
jgi:hypothetical protein